MQQQAGSAFSFSGLGEDIEESDKPPGLTKLCRRGLLREVVEDPRIETSCRDSRRLWRLSPKDGRVGLNRQPISDQLVARRDVFPEMVPRAGERARRLTLPDVDEFRIRIRGLPANDGQPIKD
jgi:hypothetical protein